MEPVEQLQIRAGAGPTACTPAAVYGAPAQGNGRANKIMARDRAVHDWYRFVLSFPPHLVRTYLDRFGLQKGQVVLDPFCGTGTTLVECKQRGIASYGLEVNPVAHFASEVKTDWTGEPQALLAAASVVAEGARDDIGRAGCGSGNGMHVAPCAGHLLRTFTPEALKLLLRDSISPLPLHKTLVLQDHVLREMHPDTQQYALLALAKTAVYTASNLKFGPEVGVGSQKLDADVVSAWAEEVGKMAADLAVVGGKAETESRVWCADSRMCVSDIPAGAVDAVITSPPYPNEKDYTRTTRLESVLLGFLTDRHTLRDLKRKLVRSNTRGVYKGDADGEWVRDHPEIQRIASEIEERRVQLGKTSGFERLYAQVTRLYFGGMARHLGEMRRVLKPGANLAYVVGDQASYLRVMIRTGQILADIAQRLGFEVVGVDLFRTRLATATGEQMREEVVVLRWPGRCSDD